MIRSVRIRNGERQLRKILKTFSGPSKVKVGFPEGTDGEVIDKAVYNEFGTRDIPERPFMRNGFREGTPELRRLARQLAGRIIAGTMTKEQALNRMGGKGKQLIQDSITDMRDPPNAQSTIDRKGSSNPLVDEGEMKGKVTWEIDK